MAARLKVGPLSRNWVRLLKSGTHACLWQTGASSGPCQVTGIPMPVIVASAKKQERDVKECLSIRLD